MKLEDLITKLTELQKTHPGLNVSLFDWRKNLGDGNGEASSSGVYGEFDIEVVKLEGDEAEYYKEQNDQEFTPWIAIGFSNEDYNDDGVLIAD